MSLKLDPTEARKADQFSSVIRESGKYVGVITRAQKLLSKSKTHGLGLSFKSDDGASANYLDIYTEKANGDSLRGASIVQAILCCTKTREANEGEITFERWDRDEGGMVKVTETGYPALMNQRIGLVLQKELQTNNITGADVERMNIVAVFDPATDMLASEILDKKTKGDKLEKIVAMVLANPVRDNRQKPSGTRQVANGSASQKPDHDPFDDDIPF